MSKAIAVVLSASWDISTGFEFQVSYGINSSTPSSPRTFVVNAGTSTVISQRDTVVALIQSAVVSDAATQYSLTLINDDVVVL